MRRHRAKKPLESVLWGIEFEPTIQTPLTTENPARPSRNRMTARVNDMPKFGASYNFQVHQALGNFRNASKILTVSRTEITEGILGSSVTGNPFRSKSTSSPGSTGRRRSHSARSCFSSAYSPLRDLCALRGYKIFMSS